MGYTIYEADLKRDAHLILRFWKRNFPKWPEEKLYWYYIQNPYGAARCWLIKEDATNDIVGAVAVFPRKIFINGSLMMAGITGDFAVDKRHRILGPALQLQRAVINCSENNSFDLLYGYPNNNSEPVQKRVGFKVVGDTTRLVKIFKTHSYIERLIRLPVLTAFASNVLDLLMKIVSKETYSKPDKRYKAAILTKFDKRFDELWEKTKKNFTISGEKSSSFLTWRYANCPFINFRTYTLSNAMDDSLIGYVVFYERDNQIIIADLLAKDNHYFLEYLLLQFLRFCRSTSCVTVSIIYLGNRFLIDILKKVGFIERKEKRNIVAYTKIKDNEALIFDQTNWFLMEGDND